MEWYRRQQCFPVPGLIDQVSGYFQHGVELGRSGCRNKQRIDSIGDTERRQKLVDDVVQVLDLSCL